MRESREYLVPDYYPGFACKMGACRASCCEGWTVSLSMEDYFLMLGVACSEPLRRKLDVALGLADNPSPEKYAEIRHRYDGNCPLRLEDGRCAVPAELGEGALPCVCRLYPRAVRSEGDYERSCAGSCEAVVERLLHHPEPLTFLRRTYPEEPWTGGRTLFFESVPLEQRLRMDLIRIVQDRSAPIPCRLMALGRRLRRFEELIPLGPASIARELDAPQNDASSVCGDPSGGDDPVFSVTPEQLAFGLRVVEEMAGLIDQRSVSLRDFGDAARAYFGSDGRELERYRRARRHFETAFPQWESFCENLLVNHMFYSRFPFADGSESLQDEFLAICAVYALLRFLFVGWMAEREDEESLVDAAAAAFRLIDHTLFHRYSARILSGLNCRTPEEVFAVISL